MLRKWNNIKTGLLEDLYFINLTWWGGKKEAGNRWEWIQVPHDVQGKNYKLSLHNLKESSPAFSSAL